MKGVRIASGLYKGRVIPFDVKNFKAEITSQKIKEAVFSIIGERMTGKSFLDLYACSGQIGFEAFSRGARPVVLNEIDYARYKFLKKNAVSLFGQNGPLITRKKSESFLRECMDFGWRFDVVFLDPPYVKDQNIGSLYESIVCDIWRYGTLRENGAIIIQHFTTNSMKERLGPYVLARSRKYGSSSISIYRFLDE
jgi:16S rRNA (guanine(966)-N(2))-methyltransferase RsmD